MNLLIVDDEMIAIKGMMNGIDWKKCGIDGNVWTAYSLRSALQILKAQPVDIMLCDIEMPGGTGIDLLREVRDFNENISCIFLTCHADFQYAQEAITLGCSDYILKPAAYAQIEESIRRVCCRITEEKKKQDIVEVFQKNSQEKQPDSMQAPSYEIVKQIEDILTENISNCEFQVANVADRLMMNKDYLNRVFKKSKGLAISHYLINERMTLAGKLLKNPQYSVNDVAEMVGYNNYPYFASSFKRFHGCPPLQYKKENEINNM